MTKLKPILRVLRQGIVVLLITCVLTEAAFRVYNYFHPSFIFYDSSYNRFRGQPYAPNYDLQLNSQGFNDVEFKVAKDPGTYRILGLGDSFTFGTLPYQNNYLTLLEEDLNRSGKKVEIINMGIPGIGPKDYLAMLANEGLKLKPDMVLLSFFIGNDFQAEPETRRLYSYSYVASFVYYLVVLKRGFQGRVVVGKTIYHDDVPTFTDDRFLSIESERSENYRKQNQQFQSDLSTALRYLIQIKRICDDRHIALVVALIPDEVQINRQLQAKVLQAKSAAASAGDFDFTLPNRLLSGKLKEQNIEVMDLFDTFAQVGTQTVLYKPNNTHWNIAGNRLAADLIGAKLLQDQLR